MKYKRFTSVIERVHKVFFCKEFHIDYKINGVDFIIDDTHFIEMKCKKRYRKTVTFVCSANQVTTWEKYYDRNRLFWMFVLYDLTQPVSSIRPSSGVEKYVTNRECWLLPWDFIYRHTIHDYPSWGPHYHFTTKDFPTDMEERIINGVKYHVSNDELIQQLFSRKEFLD